jgi:hypothetical protein
MRSWAGPIGFVGAAASFVFWVVVPNVAGSGNLYVHAGNEVFYALFVAMSLVGIAGALFIGGSTRLAPALLAVGVIPAVGALLVPGLLVIVAALLALQEPEKPETRTQAR